MVEEKELITYAIECIKSVLPGLSSRPVPPLPKGIKVDLSRIIGALIKCVESVLAGSTEPWTADMVWNAGVIYQSWTQPPKGERRPPFLTHYPRIPLQRYVAAHIHTHNIYIRSGKEIRYLTYVFRDTLAMTPSLRSWTWLPEDKKVLMHYPRIPPQRYNAP